MRVFLSRLFWRWRGRRETETKPNEPPSVEVRAPLIPVVGGEPAGFSHAGDVGWSSTNSTTPNRDEQENHTDLMHHGDMLLSGSHEVDTPKASKRPVVSVDDTVDVSHLRWVGTEFIYFLDIPRSYVLADKLPEVVAESPTPAVEGPQTQRASSVLETPMRSIIINLLEQFMEVQIPESALLSSDQRHLSADQLSRLIVPWARDLSESRLNMDAPQLSRGRLCTSLLESLTTALDQAVYSRSGSLIDGGDESGALCAVAVMLSSLERCIQAIWHLGGPEIVGRTRMFGEVTQILRQQLLTRWGGRASQEAERLFSAGIPFAAYARDCTPTLSNTSTVDPDRYVSKHVEPSCRCAHIKPPLPAIRDCIEKKEIPVLFYDGSHLHVRSSHKDPYVSVSHVWADGLGSTSETGLPGCQVERLARLARSIGIRDGLFWQDGLCIPEERALRDCAITLMAETYADADKVLVLDEGLRSACSLSTPVEECLLRIATSGWTQRIWTLQEGMLAHELYFELSDAVVDCSHFDGAPFTIAQKLIPLLDHRRIDASDSPRSGLPLAYRRRVEDAPRCSVNDLIPLLRYRQTSKPQDEPLAIAGLLGVTASNLIPFRSAEDRMKALLIEVRTVPRQLAVMGWMEPRLSLSNFGWAPRSLSHVLWPGDPDSERNPSICTEDGLFGDYTIVRFAEDIVVGEPFGVLIIIEDTRDPNSSPKIFNLVFSPPFVRRVYDRYLFPVRGFVMKDAVLRESLREEPVGAVVFPSDSPELLHPDGKYPTKTCKFVAPASFRFGLPDKVETSRSRQFWSIVYATVEPLSRIRLI